MGIKDFNSHHPRKISLDQLRKNVSGDPRFVRVGLPDSEAAQNADNLSLAALGAIHEYGVPGRIPERPFLHPAIQEGADQIRQLAAELEQDPARRDLEGSSTRATR